MSPSGHLGYEHNILGKGKPITWHGVRESTIPPKGYSRDFWFLLLWLDDNQQKIMSYNVGKKMTESDTQYLNVLDHEPPRGVLGPSKSITAMPGAH
jgi:hypothetical protein